MKALAHRVDFRQVFGAFRVLVMFSETEIFLAKQNKAEQET